jgi:hypothetical protein
VRALVLCIHLAVAVVSLLLGVVISSRFGLMLGIALALF